MTKTRERRKKKETIGIALIPMMLQFHAVVTLKEPTLNTAVRMKTGAVFANRQMCCFKETPSSSSLEPKVRWLSAEAFPIITMELVIDISPLVESSLAQKEMRETKMSWTADSLLLSANVALRESFFISGPCTKRARIFTVITNATDTLARR